jgi:hypothetical protein
MRAATAASENKAIRSLGSAWSDLPPHPIIFSRSTKLSQERRLVVNLRCTILCHESEHWGREAITHRMREGTAQYAIRQPPARGAAKCFHFAGDKRQCQLSNILRLMRRLQMVAPTLVTVCLVVVILFAPSGATATEAPRGLYVRDGVLMKDGRRYFGVGANYQTLFGRLLRNKDDTSSLDKLARLAAAGIPFVRYRACGFAPANEQLYLQNRPEFFRRMDQVVQCAEQNQIGLIPSLFWRLATVSELLGENRDQLGNPNSKASQFIRQFTREMVSRYKNSPAIWGWEFGNEANLGLDLSTPRMRRITGGLTNRDAGAVEKGRLTSQQLCAAYALFGEAVRKIDPSRIIDSGTTLPRPAAWHLAHRQGWRHDTADQGFSTLLNLTPDPLNVLSVHVYERAKEHYPEAGGIEGVMAMVTRQAAVVRKPLFIGEFPVKDRAQTQEFLHAIEVNRVPLSAFWVFDDPVEPKMNVDFDNERAFVLDEVTKANKVLQREPASR